MQSVHTLLAAQALANSSAVFVYDTTPTLPFGKDLVKTSSTEVYQCQVRPGAGSSLVGFVESIAFTSKGAEVSSEEEEEVANSKIPAKRTSTRSRATNTTKKVKTASTNSDKTISVLASTASFLALVPSLASLPSSNLRPALAIHVSAQTSSIVEDAEGAASMEQIPELGALFQGIESLEEGGWTGAVVLSETAEEAAFVGTGLTGTVTGAGYDIVNAFDGLQAGRILSKIAAAPAVDAAGQSLATILSEALSFFTYSGSATATQVLVIPASTYSSTAKAALAALTNGGNDVGVVVVRVVKPWSADAFLAALPSTTKTLHLFAEAGTGNVNGPFYQEILSTLLTPPGYNLKIRSLPLPTETLPTVQEWATKLLNISSITEAPVLKSLTPAAAKLAIFWDLDATVGETELVPVKLAEAFASTETGVEAKVDTRFDNFLQGGLQQSALLLEPVAQVSKEHNLPALVATSSPALLLISSAAAVFKAYEPISTSTVDADTRIVISANWTAEEVVAKLPLSARQALVKVSNGVGSLFIVDTDKVAATHSCKTAEIAQIVFWTMYLQQVPVKEIVSLLASNPSFSAWDNAKLVEVNSAVRNAIVQVNVEACWAVEGMAVDGSLVEKAAPLPTHLVATAAGPNADRTFTGAVATVIGKSKSSWHGAAQRLLFPEAFGVEQAVEEKFRPDLPEKNFLVTVTENRRLTPSTYDRNVFHLEFSTVGCGLNYAVGEALGIHGWNDAEEVREFLDWYGLDAEAIISTPSRVDPDGRMELRTIFQLFQQQLDLFGKPGKSFYETLSKYATNKDEERALRFIACADGHATFKKMSESDTVTYADLLRQFPSAKPKIEDLIREIEQIKPRHYSIASSQNFVGDSVHLLIVTVEWNNPKGAPRFGQCTRYLNGLKAGDKVMVSVKPSVMKLPVLDTDPIIMAGLGTGAAPFRAFIQERAYQKSIGKEVGPALYYFGSRHRSMEYLYGEEIEAYVTEGVLSHTGLAFSRDTDQKVYIQHKMNEDADLLARMLEKGTFFLCGPTWPVPDVYAALIKSFVGQGRTEEGAAAYIEKLKEEERYVLEVY